MNFLYLLGINPSLDKWFADIFSHPIACAFLLSGLFVSFAGYLKYFLVLLFKITRGICFSCLFDCKERKNEEEAIAEKVHERRRHKLG